MEITFGTQRKNEAVAKRNLVDFCTQSAKIEMQIGTNEIQVVCIKMASTNASLECQKQPSF